MHSASTTLRYYLPENNRLRFVRDVQSAIAEHHKQRKAQSAICGNLYMQYQNLVLRTDGTDRVFIETTDLTEPFLFDGEYEASRVVLIHETPFQVVANGKYSDEASEVIAIADAHQRGNQTKAWHIVVSGPTFQQVTNFFDQIRAGQATAHLPYIDLNKCSTP